MPPHNFLAEAETLAPNASSASWLRREIATVLGANDLLGLTLGLRKNVLSSFSNKLPLFSVRTRPPAAFGNIQLNAEVCRGTQRNAEGNQRAKIH